MAADDILIFDTDRFGGRELATLDPDGTVTQLTTSATWDSWFPQTRADGTTVLVRTPIGTTPVGAAYTVSDLWRRDPDGSMVLLVDISAQAPDPWTFLATPHWSPDGAQAVVARTIAGEAVRPTVLDPADGTVIADVDYDAGQALTDPSWHPDPDAGGAGTARLVYCRNGSLVRRDWDGAAPSGARTTILDATTLDTWTFNGATRIWCYDPTYSPDGTKIAFLADFNGRPPGDTAPKDWGVAVIDADGTNPTRLTPPDHIYSKPEWSTDGLWVYCHAFMGGGSVELLRVPADGTAAMPSEATITAQTGPYNDGLFSTHTGNLELDPADNGTEENPTIWENLSITGGIRILAGVEWQTVRNFEVLGETSGRPIYSVTEAALGPGVRLEYGRAGKTADSGTGAQCCYGHGSIIDLYRVELFGYSDGTILPMVMRECVVHDLRHWNVADHPEIGGDDHSDGIQGIGAFSDTLLRWNVIYGGSDAVKTGDDELQTSDHNLVEENYFRLQPGDPDPGTYVFRFDFGGTVTDTVIRRNRSGPPGSSGYATHSGLTDGVGGNVWPASGPDANVVDATEVAIP